jgi:hypothetical protein
MSVLPVGFGSSAAAAYTIDYSLRFRSSASASLSWTPGGAGNRKLLAKRFRIKRGTLGTLQVIASAGTASIDRFYFDTSNRLCLDVLGTARLVTTPVFSDPTAHYVDVGFFLDVANGTAASRAGILIDGVEVSGYSTDGRASITNTDTNWNNTVVQYIGRDNAGNYFDGYISEPISVDGSTTVNAYSETNSDGVRVPVRPSATYGTNGFYLDFSDATSTTTLGYDRSGNGNNWTLNNISLTAGATYDHMVDTPTNNYCVLNPLDIGSGTLNSANLGVAISAGYGLRSTLFIPAGKWYWETAITAGTNAAYHCPGIQQSAGSLGSYGGTVQCPSGYMYWGAGYKVNGMTQTAYGATYTTNDVIGIAFDATAGTLEFFKNGVSQGTAFTSISGSYSPYFSNQTTSNNDHLAWVNFGQRPFAYTPPTGFNALCTANIADGGSIITSGTFTGNASANGPYVWLNGNPETMTINGNAVTWGTHALKVAGGFKVITSSASYNTAGSNTFSVSVAGELFGDENTAPNTEQENP